MKQNFKVIAIMKSQVCEHDFLQYFFFSVLGSKWFYFMVLVLDHPGIELTTWAQTI